MIFYSASWKKAWSRNLTPSVYVAGLLVQKYKKGITTFLLFVLIIFHQTDNAKKKKNLITFTCIAELVLYLWGGDVEHLSDLAVQLLDIRESVDAACGTPVSQLGVEDESRPRVLWWPWWWRWRWRKWRGCGLHTPLTLGLVRGLLLLHGLSPFCFGVLRAHSLPVLHWAPAQV